MRLVIDKIFQIGKIVYTLTNKVQKEEAMSFNAEQAPNAGAQAGVGALLMEIGKRAPSSTQAVKVCQILGIATRENIRQVREFAKNKNTKSMCPGQSQIFLAKAKPEAKKQKEEKMKAMFSRLIGRKVRVYIQLLENGASEIDAIVVKVGKEYIELSNKNSAGLDQDVFWKYDQIVGVAALK